jgi:hypothetical protein
MVYSTQQTECCAVTASNMHNDKCRTLRYPAQQLAGLLQVHMYHVGALAFSQMQIASLHVLETAHTCEGGGPTWPSAAGSWGHHRCSKLAVDCCKV